MYRVRHKSVNTPLSHERLVGGLQDGGRGTHVTHFVQLYPQPLYTASQVRTTCRSWDEGVLTDVCLTGVLTDLCLTGVLTDVCLTGVLTDLCLTGVLTDLCLTLYIYVIRSLCCCQMKTNGNCKYRLMSQWLRDFTQSGPSHSLGQRRRFCALSTSSWYAASQMALNRKWGTCWWKSGIIWKGALQQKDVQMGVKQELTLQVSAFWRQRDTRVLGYIYIYI